MGRVQHWPCHQAGKGTAPPWGVAAELMFPGAPPPPPGARASSRRLLVDAGSSWASSPLLVPYTDSQGPGALREEERTSKGTWRRGTHGPRGVGRPLHLEEWGHHREILDGSRVPGWTAGSQQRPASGVCAGA